jgi:hypothetical protein
MSKPRRIDVRFATLFAFVLLAGVIRLVTNAPHSPIGHLTPLGAMALFGGAHLTDRWKAVGLPLLTLWLSDVVLNRFVYFGEWVLVYPGFLWVYGTFAGIALGSRLWLRTVTVPRVAAAGVAASLTHWLVTDLGVWLSGCTNPVTGALYPPTLAGYAECLLMAVPYLQNFLIGTLAYSAVLFGGFALAEARFPAIAQPRSVPCST